MAERLPKTTTGSGDLTGGSASAPAGEIVGCVGFHPCKLGDARYHRALLEAYMPLARQAQPDASGTVDCTLALVAAAGEAQAQAQAEQWAAKEGELRRMSVQSGLRGLGIGKLLVAALVRRAASLGYAMLHLTTGVLMPAAYEFYHSLGMRDVGHVFIPQSEPSGDGCHGQGSCSESDDDEEFVFEEVHYRATLTPWSGAPLPAVECDRAYAAAELRAMAKSTSGACKTWKPEEPSTEQAAALPPRLLQSPVFNIPLSRPPPAQIFGKPRAAPAEPVAVAAAAGASSSGAA